MNTISTEFPGFWIASHSASAHSTGVAIGIATTYGITRQPEDDHTDLEGGRLVGMAIKTADDIKYFIISAYSPCLVSSTQVEHLAFLNRVTSLALEKRKEGYQPLIFGNLNCIRDKRLDAKNGGEIYPGQSNWFTTMETNADLHDVQRYLHPNEYLESWSHGRKNTLKRFRRLDYIMASRSTLSKVTDIKVTPTLSDHRMLTLHLSKKQEKIGGPGYWQHPDHRLKDQDYTDTIDFA